MASFSFQTKAMYYLKEQIEKEYDENFNLDKYIDEILEYYNDFRFTKPIEVVLALQDIDKYIGTIMEHNYDIHVIETMYLWVVANNDKEELEKYVEELKCSHVN